MSSVSALAGVPGALRSIFSPENVAAAAGVGTLASPTKSSNAVTDLVTLWSAKDLTVGALEKHLDDYGKGQGYLSKETALQLGDTNQANASQLSHRNPNALKLYSSVYGALDYQQRARFVKGVNDSVSRLDQLFA